MTTEPTTTEIIRHGEIVSLQLTPMCSNYTFLVKIDLKGNESLAIYCAPVDASQVSGVHGLPTEGEDIQVQVIERETLWHMCEQGKLTNAATIIATQWLQLHHLRLQQEWMPA